MNKRPLLVCSVFLGMGIYGAEEEKTAILILIVALLFLIALYKKHVFPLLCILFLFAGFLRLKQTESFTKPLETLKNNQDITVVGKLYKTEVKNNKEYLYLKNAKFINKNKYSSINSILIISANHVNSHIGNLIKVRGTFQQLNKAKNPGAFDEAKYFRNLKISAKVNLKSYKIVDTTIDEFGEWIFHLRTQMEKTYEKLCSKKDSTVLCAMILGDKTKLEEDTKSIYQDAGVMHILAISGLHISIVGMACYRLFRRIGLGILISSSFCAIIIFGYGLLTGLSISATRAAFMFGVYLGAQIYGKTYDLLSAIGLTAFFVLYENPLMLYQGGFLLSFSAVFIIALVNEIQRKENQEIKEDEKYEKDKTSKWKKKTKKEIIKYFKDGLRSSFCIQLGTLPIVAYFYFETAGYAVFLNLIVLILVPWILQLGIAGGILGTTWPAIGSYFLKACFLLIWLNESFCKIPQKLPLERWIIGRPDLWQILFYYLLLFFFFRILHDWKGNKTKKAVLMLLSIIMINILSFHFHRGVEITSLFVGQGDGIFFWGPEGKTYFIDGGSSDLKQVGEYQILPFLKSKGIKKIHCWFVTHTDMDHISGLKEILKKEYPIHYLILPKIKTRNKEYLELIKLAHSAGTKVFAMEKGDLVQEGEMMLRCLYPSYHNLVSEESCNETSLVLSLEYAGINALFTGDIESRGEEILQRENNLLDYHILKVAHHGSKNSTSENFLKIIKPEFSIISCGENNFYGHPHQELLNRLNAIKSKVHITSQEGAVSINILNISSKRVKMIVEKFLLR